MQQQVAEAQQAAAVAEMRASALRSTVLHEREERTALVEAATAVERDRLTEAEQRARASWLEAREAQRVAEENAQRHVERVVANADLRIAQARAIAEKDRAELLALKRQYAQGAVSEVGEQGQLSLHAELSGSISFVEEGDALLPTMDVVTPSRWTRFKTWLRSLLP